MESLHAQSGADVHSMELSALAAKELLVHLCKKLQLRVAFFFSLKWRAPAQPNHLGVRHFLGKWEFLHGGTTVCTGMPQVQCLQKSLHKSDVKLVKDKSKM